MVKIDKKTCAFYLRDILKFKNIISAIYIYGSITKNKEANDIDILIIVDDSSQELSPVLIDRMVEISKNITEKGKEKGFNFHFQPIKKLSSWWNLLLEGEPWIVSSLSDPWIIYEKKEIISEASLFIKESKIFSKEEKAEKLMERGEMYLYKNREILLNSIHSLAEAATEAAQILLLFDDKLILNKNKIIDELEKNYKKIIGEEIVGNYKEIVDLENKMEEGFLSEFSAENLDYYLNKIKRFIEKTEEILSKK